MHLSLNIGVRSSPQTSVSIEWLLCIPDEIIIISSISMRIPFSMREEKAVKQDLQIIAVILYLLLFYLSKDVECANRKVDCQRRATNRRVRWEAWNRGRRGDYIWYSFDGHISDLDYNFSWFEGAKEQKCMCGAANCRGFIGKRKAAPPTKVESVKNGKTVASKVKRVVRGRITKVSKKKVKAHVKDGKVIKATIVTTRTKIKTTKKTKFETTAQKVKTLAPAKKTTTLGKRKRASPTTKAAKRSLISPKKSVSTRKISKPRSSTTVKSPKALSNRPIYDTVSHRSRKRNVR